MTACRSARPAGVSSAQVVRLYEALGRSDEAANWRKELEAAKK